MLKIKSNIDLKELEKYGFKEGKYDYLLENNGCMVEISKENKEIFMWDDYEGTKFDSGLNILYDLIQAGLVEKV